MDHRRLTTALLFLAACADNGSLGNYSESGGEGSGSAGEDTTASASGDPTTSSASSATSSTDDTTTDTETASETTDEPTSTGDTDDVTCDQPGNCLEFSPCDVSACGGLESLFDADGCLRQECSDDRQCNDGERCYRAMDFGGCAPSGVFCEDDRETQSCQCGSNPECGGGFCVPEELYPTASPLPEGVVFADAACSPDDGPAIYMQWGGFGACDLDEAVLAITVFEGPLAVGIFEFGGSTAGFGRYFPPDLGMEVEVVTATLEITAFDGALVSGSLVATLAPNDDGIAILAGELVDVPYCGSDPMCG